MKHVYGPVFSRRLGRSLGVDPLVEKACNWNCVYCQVGRTPRFVTRRDEFHLRESILADVETALATDIATEIDWVTFAGNGEPTLHSELGWLIERTKRLTSVPVAVVTNGSLLGIPAVRDALAQADAVLPTLAAGSASVFRSLHRPASSVSFEDHVDGLVRFRREYAGQLWVEVMLVESINDSPEQLGDLARLLQRVEPDQIHLTLPVRPPAVKAVRPPREDTLERCREILGGIALRDGRRVFDQ